MFKVKDRIIIESNEGFIGGIHNHDCLDVLIDKFGEFVKGRIISKCWAGRLDGTIVCIGKYNSYIIKTDNGKYYNFSNNYNEMRLNDE